MQIYQQRQIPNRDFLVRNSVYLRPESAVEAVMIIRYLSDHLNLPFIADSDGKQLERYISCACREGILVDNGKICIDSGDIKYKDNVYVMSAAQLIPDYQSPMTHLFNQMAEKITGLETRLAQIEENTARKGPARGSIISEDTPPRFGNNGGRI